MLYCAINHQVANTPFGNKADVNAGTDGAPIFLTYRAAVPDVINRIKAVSVIWIHVAQVSYVV